MAKQLSMIDTDGFSIRMRTRGVDLEARRLLVTNFYGTEQEKDLTVPPNADGLGRIRHFIRQRNSENNWPLNPLPIDPAYAALGLPPAATIRAQVFQNAVCNWRCWYCFVPFELLSGNEKYSAWVDARTLIDLYRNQADPPPMIDLTGGQPDLVPEWVPWMMEALEDAGLSESVYLWSDDNLSNDYFWQYLTDADRERIGRYRNYGRVCCFKGFNANSFSFNTRAEPDLFIRQFELMRRLMASGIDLYAYTTFTTPHAEGIPDDMARFVDSLQEIHPNMPLRTVPLEIGIFTPVQSRLKDEHRIATKNQYLAADAWREELSKRFTATEREARITDVPLSHK